MHFRGRKWCDMKILEIRKIDIENYDHITFIRIDSEDLLNQHHFHHKGTPYE